MLRLLAILLGVTQAYAQAGSGGQLIFPSQTAACQRSVQMCTAMGCDGVHTKYWWDCSTALQAGNVGGNAVPAGSFAVRIDSGQYGPTASNQVSGGTQGLTAQEQAAVVPPSTANGSTVFPWVISTPSFKARWTPTQISAMNNSTNPLINPTWNNLSGAATVNMQASQNVTMVNAAVADGIITVQNAQTILAPTIAPVPPP